MSSSEVTKQGSNEVSQPAQQGVMETKEQSAKANASVRYAIKSAFDYEHIAAGINLNIFGAIAGAFSGKEKTETAPDGSSTMEREGQGKVKGAGEGTLSAVGAASAEENARQTRAAITQDKS